MILQELKQLYHNLMQDEKKIEDGLVYPPGFSNEGIGFRIVINRSGELVSIEDLREGEGSNIHPSRYIVPKWDGKRASGIRPYFLWDNAKYILGADKHGAEAKASFIRFIEEVCSIAGYKPKVIESINSFLTGTEEVEKVEQHKNYDDLINSNSFIGFSIYGSEYFLVTDNEAVKQVWLTYLHRIDNDSDSVAEQLLSGKNKEEQKEILKRHSFPTVHIDLVTGKTGPVYKLQPTIKRAVGQSGKNDVPLISFNQDSFLSYGLKKQFNASVSRETSFAYTTALNYLINNSDHNLFIGDTRTLFWAQKNRHMESLFGLMLSGPVTVETADKNLIIYLKSLQKGIAPPQLIEDNSRFYILGLAPNAARVSVKYWYTATVSEIISHLTRHLNDAAIIGPDNIRFPTIRNLLRQTAAGGKDENIPSPQIAALYRTVLEGYPYPSGVLALLLNRMRHDQDNKQKQIYKIGYYRAAFIKAVLNRNYQKELTMALDKSRNSHAYLCGRLFAVLEKVQRDALGEKINATIKDRYFSTASTNPAVVFPQIIRLSQSHQKKMRSEHPDWVKHNERMVQEIMQGINTFPAYFNIEGQGEFAIGYYHQVQDFYTKNNNEKEE
jgi:CRISPR-associated protein Csd1